MLLDGVCQSIYKTCLLMEIFLFICVTQRTLHLLIAMSLVKLKSIVVAGNTFILIPGA